MYLWERLPSVPSTVSLKERKAFISKGWLFLDVFPLNMSALVYGKERSHLSQK